MEKHQKMTSRPSPRVLKVGEEIKRVLAQYFGAGHTFTQGLDLMMITINEVRMSPDLKLAKVYVTSLTQKDPLVFLKLLTLEKPHVRKYIASHVHLKFVPEVSFKLDDSLSYASRIETLLADPKVVQDITKPDES